MDGRHSTPLHFAAGYNRVAVVEYLLQVIGGYLLQTIGVCLLQVIGVCLLQVIGG